MLTRRERLLRTLRGEPVDRPPVSFYEIGGWKLDPDDPDPYNVFNAPAWRPLLRLAEEETDLIRMLSPDQVPAAENCADEFLTTVTHAEDGTTHTVRTLHVGGRTLTSRTRRDADVWTTWTVEHLLKSVEDVRAYLQLPDEFFAYEYQVSNLIAEEEQLGDAGIVMVDVADPICRVAALFSMADYTVMAFTEPSLFHQLLEKHARYVYPMVEQVSREFPEHLWRVVGSEYASEPFLPPRLYREYVVRYTQPIVDAIQRHGGYARIHSHGRLRHILPHIVSMGATGLDPIEPPPQGDVELADVRREYGAQLALFGNIEAVELETMPPSAFASRVAQALRDGTAGTGRGFVLMPSSCPYGRDLGPNVLANYETMVRLTQDFRG